MKTLVVGATGATGQKLVEQLLDRGLQVTVIVRSPGKFSKSLRENKRLFIIEASVLDLSSEALKGHVEGCDAVASCLGHTLSFKGIYGPPRRLVTLATQRLCNAIKANKPAFPTKFVLMNTTGNRNRDLNEPRSFLENSVIMLLRFLLPPHVDNEKAAEYLRTQVGQDDDMIEWTAVRLP